MADDDSYASRLVPDKNQRELLETATRTYYGQVKEVAPYLTSRGIVGRVAGEFRLGYVGEPLPGHDAYRGMLSIPYLTRSGTVSIRFRRIGDEGPKYKSMPGDPHRIYNPKALFDTKDYIAICEGELDAITMHSMVGVPAIGLPGASGWKDVFARCLVGYKRVFIAADSDDSGVGVELAEKIARRVKNALIVPMPPNHDVNSYYMEAGASGVKEVLGLE